MGKNNKKSKKFAITLCPVCGNEIPYYSKFRLYYCKYCNSQIQPEDNTVREVIDNEKSK